MQITRSLASYPNTEANLTYEHNSNLNPKLEPCSCENQERFPPFWVKFVFCSLCSIQEHTCAHINAQYCCIFFLIYFFEECALRFDGYRLKGLCLDASQGGAPSKSTQETAPSHGHISGGNTLPADFINSKWKLWDLSGRTMPLWGWWVHLCVRNRSGLWRKTAPGFDNPLVKHLALLTKLKIHLNPCTTCLSVLKWVEFLP